MNWVAHTFVHFTVANRKVTEGLGWALKGLGTGGTAAQIGAITPPKIPVVHGPLLA